MNICRFYRQIQISIAPYFKDMHNQTQVREMGEVVMDEDYFPPKWIGIVAPSLDRHGKWVRELIGDVLAKEPEIPVL